MPGVERDAGGGRRAPGELIAAVRAVLERSGRPLTAAEVRDEIGADLAYSTVITTLGRLWAQGLLTRERHARAHRYALATDEAGLAAHRMRRVLDGRDDRAEVLSRFVSDLDDRDEDVLRRLLAEHDDTDSRS